MPPVRIGVIGAGLIGRKHISVLRSGLADFALAGVADPAPAAKAEGEQLGYPVYGSIEEMLDRAKPDGVIVAVPNQMHVSAGLACVARKLPIIIEKPVADTVGEALTLIEAAEKAGVATLTGHHRRHNPIMRRAAEIVRDGSLGKIAAVTAMWLSRKPEEYFDAAWRREPGGGTVLINGIHEIDNLRLLLGDVDTVQATTATAVRGFPVEDTAAAVLRFKSGVIGTITICDTAATPWSWEWGSAENPFYPQLGQDCVFVAGTRGSLSIPSLQLRWYDGKQDWGLPLSEMRQHVRPADAYVEQMKNFAGVIRGTEKPVLTGRDGTVTLATTLAITRSARSGLPVKVDDMLAEAASVKGKSK